MDKRFIGTLKMLQNWLDQYEGCVERAREAGVGEAEIAAFQVVIETEIRVAFCNQRREDSVCS